MYINLVKNFWDFIDQAEFDKLKGIMTSDATVWLPNTSEVFRGSDKYIAFNKKYPGRWHAQIHSLFTNESVVISIVKVFDPEEKISFFVTSIFSFSDHLISDIKEYWGENGEAPQWRIDEGLSEFY